MIFGDYYWSYLFIKKIQSNHNFEIILIVTSEKKEKTFVKLKEKNIEEKIELYESNNFEKIYKKLIKLKYDYILSVAYSRIFKGIILEKNYKKILNIHPSYLPERGGPDPVRNGIIEEDKYFGITLHLVNEKVDCGMIVSRYKFKNNQRDDTELILKKLAQKFFKSIFLDIVNLKKNNLKNIRQNKLISFAPRITEEQLLIRRTDTIDIIKKKIRATLPYKNLKIALDGKKLIIKKIIFEKKKHFTKFTLTEGHFYFYK